MALGKQIDRAGRTVHMSRPLEDNFEIKAIYRVP